MVTGLSFTGQTLMGMRRNTGCDWLRIPVTHELAKERFLSGLTRRVDDDAIP